MAAVVGDGGLEKLPQLTVSNIASKLIASVDIFNGRITPWDDDCFNKYCKGKLKRQAISIRSTKYFGERKENIVRDTAFATSTI